MAKPTHVYLIAAARKIWRWSAARREAIKAAMVGPDLIQCALCRKKLPAKVKVRKRFLYSVDHISPVVEPGRRSPTLNADPATDSSELTWDEYLRRMIYGKLQVLCNPCHSKKSKAENKERRERKQKRQTVPALRNGPNRR
jgi:5-methylcytosine-specific restriction endonuclease McrA